MNRKINIIGLTLFFTVTLFSFVFSEESITITTYYPSPYGSYNELTTTGHTYLATNSGSIVGIGTSSPNARLDVKGFGATYDTYGFGVTNSNGIYSLVVRDDGNVGIGKVNPGAKLDVSGNIKATLADANPGIYCMYNTTTRELTYLASSLRYKKDIHDLQFDKRTFLSLAPRSFRWKSDNTKDIGFVAEDVEKIMPEMVIYKDGQPDSIRYSQIPIYLFSIVKEQQKQIDTLKQEIGALKERLNTKK